MPRGAKPGERRGGRAKGTPNKITADMRAAIEGAFTHLEESTDGFAAWAEANQTIFYTQLMPKVIPLQVNHAGNEGGPLQVIINRQGNASD